MNIPGGTPEIFWQRAVYFPFVDHFIQELNDSGAFVTRQYLFPARLNAFNSGVRDKLYETYKTDPSERVTLTIKFEGGKQSGLIQLMENQRSSQRHSKTKKSLEETHVNPDLYPNMVTIITIFLTMPVSTATHERSFSTMNRVKAYLRFTMKTEWLAALALMRAYKDISIDAKAVIRESSPKNKRLAFEFLWVPPRFQICLHQMCR